jgi:hypothetical protein
MTFSLKSKVFLETAKFIELTPLRVKRLEIYSQNWRVKKKEIKKEWNNSITMENQEIREEPKINLCIMEIN